MKHLRAFKMHPWKDLSSISKCTALELKHVNNSPYLFKSFLTLFCVEGAKTITTPEYENGGEGSTLSAGRSAIRCSSTGLRIFLQVTQLLINLATTLLAPKSSIHWLGVRSVFDLDLDVEFSHDNVQVLAV